MQQKEGQFKGTDNHNLYWRCWLPDGQAKAVILVAHGLGEHISRYNNVANKVVPLGYAVYGLDHQGHGKSEGQRVYVKRFQTFLNDLHALYKMAHADNPDKKIFLYGHSMGGLIATVYALQHQHDLVGLVISAPALKPGESISPAIIGMARFLSAVTPRMGVQALDSTYISQDKSVVEAYDKDPLVYRGKITARLGSELFTTMKAVDSRLQSIVIPLLILQGSEDKMVNQEGAKALYAKAGSKDKTLKIYEGFYHEVHNEPDKDRVFTDMGMWLADHT